MLIQVELMPAVEEANSISEELDKKVKFEILLISAQMREKLETKSHVSKNLIKIEWKEILKHQI